MTELQGHLPLFSLFSVWKQKSSVHSGNSALTCSVHTSWPNLPGLDAVLPLPFPKSRFPAVNWTLTFISPVLISAVMLRGHRIIHQLVCTAFLKPIHKTGLIRPDLDLLRWAVHLIEVKIKNEKKGVWVLDYLRMQSLQPCKGRWHKDGNWMVGITKGLEKTQWPWGTVVKTTLHTEFPSWLSECFSFPLLNPSQQSQNSPKT